MANELTAQLSLVGTAANFGDALALTTSDTLDVTKDVVGVSKVQLSTVSLEIGATSYGKSFVYLKNIDNSININIKFGSDVNINLGPSEFAFFPWDGVNALGASSVSGTPFLEYAIFES
jgi:hypothetical protein